ncbi:LacI family transcriptional regulator [Glaciihabitans sp. INWT7]|uniref:LacI family DNA-binding transcriptional regulator n=1 Tax=Glaciihabitans sp. INWT7 TaxID=2596912 RepID=UPI001624937C|nr:LacI family DNA-binding transcriptional regulator [Glaciihabitans sp. INWT7]QNE48090.1 LacI family transcriptional regulator [Glaciihabitans sp. INWT7]
MSQLPTVLDVGRVAGVSRQTVSNVLNSPQIVKPETRQKVEAAIAQLGYRPHASARRLRTQKSSTLGIRLDPMTNGISGSLLDRFLHALTEQADRRGLRVMLFTATGPEDEIRQFARLRDGADVDGFVLTATFVDDPRTEWLIENNVPFVTFGRPWGIDDMNDPRHLWVDVDGRSGVRDATDHLLDGGASHVAFLGWPTKFSTGDDRRRGWREAMEARSGLDAAQLDALQADSEDDVAAASQAIRSLIESGVRVDAVACASDSLALGALLVVGAEVSVVGYDNTPVAGAIGLSSVEQPLDEVAVGALDLLLGDGSHGIVGWESSSPERRHRLVTPRLVVRERSPIGRLA